MIEPSPCDPFPPSGDGFILALGKRFEAEKNADRFGSRSAIKGAAYRAIIDFIGDLHGGVDEI